MPEAQTTEQLGNAVERWDKELAAYTKVAEKWTKEVEGIVDRFMMTDKDYVDWQEYQPARFNALWSNTETVSPVHIRQRAYRRCRAQTQRPR